MKRQTENVRTMVYAYGCVPQRIAPVENEDAALVQMRLARRLWNVLAAIERARIEGYRRIMRDETQEQIDALKARKDAIWEEIRTLRQKARKKVPVPVELRDEQARIKAALAMLLEHQTVTRQQRHDARRDQLTVLNERSNKRIKKARQAASSIGLYWGTYNAVVQSADAGRKHGGELRFRGFRGDGTLTAQVMGGADREECVGGGHSFFRVESAAGGRKWRYARLRIGSTPKREPVWLAIPIVYHRELPAVGRIKSVSATRRIVAGKVRWQLNVTVTLPPVLAKQPGLAVAVDIGWRLMPDGGRVGYWYDDLGRHGEVAVPSGDLEQFAQVENLRSLCDERRNEILPMLAEWLAARTDLNDEWRQRSAHLAQWRSSDRLAALVRWWSDHRLNDDADIYAAALGWRKRYLHLADWWRNLQDQMTLRLREQYRVFAARMAREYATVILEDFDLREVSEAKPEETAGDRQKTGQHTRHHISPSVFRGALINACKREGVEVRIVSGAYSTATCHLCHVAEKWDQAASVMHRCGHCGSLWDQDYNAAVNLLASGKVPPTKNQVDSPGILPGSGDRSQNEGKEAMEAMV